MGIKIKSAVALAAFLSASLADAGNRNRLFIPWSAGEAPANGCSRAFALESPDNWGSPEHPELFEPVSKFWHEKALAEAKLKADSDRRLESLKKHEGRHKSPFDDPAGRARMKELAVGRGRILESEKSKSDDQIDAAKAERPRSKAHFATSSGFAVAVAYDQTKHVDQGKKPAGNSPSKPDGDSPRAEFNRQSPFDNPAGRARMKRKALEAP